MDDSMGGGINIEMAGTVCGIQLIAIALIIYFPIKYMILLHRTFVAQGLKDSCNPDSFKIPRLMTLFAGIQTLLPLIFLFGIYSGYFYHYHIFYYYGMGYESTIYRFVFITFMISLGMFLIPIIYFRMKFDYSFEYRHTYIAASFAGSLLLAFITLLTLQSVYYFSIFFSIPAYLSLYMLLVFVVFRVSWWSLKKEWKRGLEAN